MTWSIVARDAEGRFGIAIASRFFAVGVLCVHARAGVGALATQALVNPHYGPAGLDALAAGATPDDVVARLTEADAGRAQRQLHLVDAKGRVAAHTGAACIDACGHLLRDGYSVAGNMLASPAVLDETARAYARSRAPTLAERLLDAMAAGEAAGGDRRGKQAAALRIQGEEAYPSLDLRVDDHAEPIAELRRLHAVSLERFQPFVACLPRRGDATGVLDRERIEARIAAFAAARRAGDR